MLWDKQKEQQLDSYLETYFSGLNDCWRYYQDIDYKKLAKILDFDDLDLIKLKTDELFDSKVFTSNFQIEPTIVESTKKLHLLNQSIQREIDLLGLDDFIKDEDEMSPKPEIDNLEPEIAINSGKSFLGERRVSLDLMQTSYRPNLHKVSRPAPINATIVNINVEPLKFSLPPATTPSPIKPKPVKSFVFKFGKNSKNKAVPLQTTQPIISDPTRIKQARRTSFMEESLPAYIKQQIERTRPNESQIRTKDDHLPTLSQVTRSFGKQNVDAKLSNDNTLESTRSNSHTIVDKSPSPVKAPPVVKIIDETNTKTSSNQNSETKLRLKNSDYRIDEEIDDSDLMPNTNRFYNLLSNSQHLYSHTKDVSLEKQPESPTTTVSEQLDTTQALTEDEYILPQVITRYYELQNEDSQEREEFLRALDQDDDTDFINFDENSYQNDNNDNDTNDTYKNQQSKVEEEYLF